MKLRLFSSSSNEFKRWMTSLRARRRTGNPRVEAAAARIVAAVRRGGDRALLALTKRLDRVELSAQALKVKPQQLEAATSALPVAERRALALAARRIRDFHRRELERSFAYRDEVGIRLGQIVRPMARVGIYVPGGQASYPSSVLMNAIPAAVAGVPEVVMVSPLRPGPGEAAVLAAAALAGVTEVYRVGGAQAVAALAYGTETIGAVDKIVGPGNAYVQAAKRLVFGTVDIDTVAGPSEVMIIADDTANPRWVAADLIAQAEHGSGDECAILATPSAKLAEAVSAALSDALGTLPRARSVRTALLRNGALIVVADVEEAFALANQIAPEHLELELSDARRWAKMARTAGAIFIGSHSPAPLGDYLAGPNHVLPTAGAARFASPLGVYDFVKRSSIIEASASALRKLGPTVARLARLEGLEGHARAIELRLASNAAD
jgi:histidinol dehydrogenase